MVFVTATMHHHTSRLCHWTSWLSKKSREFFLEIQMAVLARFVLESSRREKHVTSCHRHFVALNDDKRHGCASKDVSGHCHPDVQHRHPPVNLTLSSCVCRLMLSNSGNDESSSLDDAVIVLWWFSRRWGRSVQPQKAMVNILERMVNILGRKINILEQMVNIMGRMVNILELQLVSKCWNDVSECLNTVS